MSERKEQLEEFAEERASLLKITTGPLIWAIHFVICYGLVAVNCAKGWDIGMARTGLLVFSVGALVAIVWVGWGSWRQWNLHETGDYFNSWGRAEDRHHFLGHAAFLLAIISFLGVVFVSLPLVMLGGCS
ncbi:hypothetical protein [Roseovarius indicus]|uniref:Transmembrane protein n=1 Tax=Roseovarius indicus TaxID=540747 RepID=A0A0T5PD89_9RHOB|nr:hypothetical protein [Roseovarius indicus]KRS18984.1 hypothetical protein XM52_04735 [Roseovarius indicus]QEW26083.1 hypothetical protein RIdsm_01877 [Roseovarius indicus]SFD92972.1 hypothetical protein SAMN04488031_103290 [Roseovarius indicus]